MDMKTTTILKKAGIPLIVGMIVALVGAIGADAQYWSSSSMGRSSYCSPSLIQFTGTVFSRDEESAATRSGDVFDLVIDRKNTWVFVIERARNRSCIETQLGILKDLYPRRLYLSGAEDQLAFLQNPDIAGEPITVQGYLYRESRRFDVTKAEKVTAE